MWCDGRLGERVGIFICSLFVGSNPVTNVLLVNLFLINQFVWLWPIIDLSILQKKNRYHIDNNCPIAVTFWHVSLVLTTNHMTVFLVVPSHRDDTNFSVEHLNCLCRSFPLSLYLSLPLVSKWTLLSVRISCCTPAEATPRTAGKVLAVRVARGRRKKNKISNKPWASRTRTDTYTHTHTQAHRTGLPGSPDSLAAHSALI